MKGKYKLQTLLALGRCRQSIFVDLRLVLQRGLWTQAIRNRSLQKAETGNTETKGHSSISTKGYSNEQINVVSELIGFILLRGDADK